MKSVPHLVSLLLVALDCHAQAPDWAQAQPTQLPFSRIYHAMAYDSDRQVTVMFGGRDVFINRHADTWEYDGKTWTEIKPVVSPPARESHGLVYDSVRKVTVLYGGYLLRDTWTWDGSVWTKIKIPPAQKPTLRLGFEVAYDARRGRTVLFGGYDATKGLVNDLWEFDGAVWTKMTSATPSPEARGGHGLVYDSLRKVVVLFGGSGQTRALGDTWEWDGVSWRQVTPATTAPTPRFVEKLVYDSHRRRTVMYGGYSFKQLNETWEYDGNDWVLVNTRNRPPYRQAFDAAFDADRGRTVLFGGDVGGHETWEYWGSPCSMTADVGTISIATGGTQTLTLDAGPVFAHKPYWIFGSITGTSPGISLNGIDIPLNVDVYTQLAMENVTANPPYKGFRSALDANGTATAQFILPANALGAGFSLYHSYIVFDASGRFYGASNPVTVRLQ